MDENQLLIKKVKGKNRFCFAMWLVGTLVLLMLSTPSRFYMANVVDLESKGLIPLPTAVAYLVIYAYIWLCIYTHNMARVTRLLTADCRPDRYYIVKQAVNPSLMKNESEKAYLDMTTAYYIGDFQAALALEPQLVKSKKTLYRLSAVYCAGWCSYYLGERDTLIQKADFLSEAQGSVKSKRAREYAEQGALALQILISFCDEKYEEAGQLNEKKKEKMKPEKDTITVVSHAFLNGLCAYYNGKKQDAIYFFMSAKEKGGTTFWAQKASEHLKELEQAKQ